MASMISIKNLCKTYASGEKALIDVSLEIEEGEILALLGPNGAGKTTLISAICGIVTPTSGQILVNGHDVERDFRKARALIGLVPQEIALEPFGKPILTMRFSRGLYGCKPDPAYLEKVLRQLSLWDKREAMNNELSGCMKRRVLIAKALSHAPRVLFLDEPTAGVDVELRKEMWDVVRALKADGVTIILTTHYIEEAEEIADRVGVINGGELLLVEDKDRLMERMGRKEMVIELKKPIKRLPKALADHNLELSEDGSEVVYTYDKKGSRTGITKLLQDLNAAGLYMSDLRTRQSSLEEIFVDLVKEKS